MESKILQDFFEKQHRKFKERAHAILQSTLGRHDSPTGSSGWHDLREESGSIPSHPLGVAPPGNGDNRIGKG